jgi:quercetin dioxygenase-like cupin family protein
MKPEKIRMGHVEVNFLLTSADTNGALATFEFTVPAGAKVPLPHYHKDYDETLYGLEGVITFTVEGKRVDLGAGATCFVPRGAVHGFNNHGSVASKTLAVITPALLGPEYFRDIAAAIPAGGPPDPEKIKAVMAKHGLVAVPPKPA